MNVFALTADRGLRDLTRDRSPRAVVGTNVYDQTTETLAQMRRIEAAAETLEHEVRRYASDPTFITAWTRWFQQAWRPFYLKYAGPNADLSWQAASGVLFGAELSRRTESYRQQLEGWYADYRTQRQKDGSPVPPPTGAIPSPARETGKASSLLPWWAWTALGAGTVVAAYAGFRYLTAEARLAGRLATALDGTPGPSV